MRLLFKQFPDSRDDTTTEVWRAVKELKRLLKVKANSDLFYDFCRELTQDEMNALWNAYLMVLPAHLIESEVFSMEYKFRQSKGVHFIVLTEYEVAQLWDEVIREDDHDHDNTLEMEMVQFMCGLARMDEEDDEGATYNTDPDADSGLSEDATGMSEAEMDAIFSLRNAPDSPVVVEWEDRHKMDVIISSPKAPHERN